MSPIESAIEFAQYSLDAYFSDGARDQRVVALMVGLRHLCDKHGLDYYSLADRSYDTYLVDKDEATRPVDRH